MTRAASLHFSTNLRGLGLKCGPRTVDGPGMRFNLLVVLALLPPAALAEKPARLTVDDLVHSSDIVAEGAIARTIAFVDEGMVFTHFWIEVDNCLVGRCGRRLIVRAAGSRSRRDAGAPVSSPPVSGNRVLLFLSGDQAPYEPVGAPQGVFIIVGSGVEAPIRQQDAPAERALRAVGPSPPATLGQMRAAIRTAASRVQFTADET